MGSAYAQVVLADSPLAYWRLGEASGTVAADSSGNGFPGTIVGGVTLGQAGALSGDTDTAALFNGSTGQIQVASAPQLNDVFSVEFWYRHSGTFGQEEIWNGTGIRVKFAPDNNCYVVASAGQTMVTSGGIAPTDANWHHVVVTKNGASQAIYIDGVAQPVTIANQTNSGYAGIGYIGCLGGSSEFCGAGLDEVAVYSTALPAGRVQAHYEAGRYGLYGDDLDAYAYAGLDGFTYAQIEELEPGLVNLLSVSLADQPAIGSGAARQQVNLVTLGLLSEPATAKGTAVAGAGSLTLALRLDDPDIFAAIPLLVEYATGGSTPAPGGAEPVTYSTAKSVTTEAPEYAVSTR